MDILKTKPADIEVGVVGIGLMGSSIIVSLLASGHYVKAIAPIPNDLQGSEKRITEHLLACSQTGLFKESVSSCLDRLDISIDYNRLSNSSLVLECVVEDIDIKSQVYKKITDVVLASIYTWNQ